MSRELPFFHHLEPFLPRTALTVMLGLSLVLPIRAQTQRPSLPDPVKFLYKSDIVANTVHEVLEDMGFRIEVDDRQAGRITTRPYDFITGSLTASEVDKVAIRQDTITGTWLKARYSVEAVIEIVSPSETMLTIRTKMEGLNRDVDGTERWLPLESLGTYERRILGKISMKLIGSEAPAEKRKGFWGKSPQPVDPRQPKFPTPPSR